MGKEQREVKQDTEDHRAGSGDAETELRPSDLLCPSQGAVHSWTHAETCTPSNNVKPCEDRSKWDRIVYL